MSCHIIESNELNNILVLKRAAIAVVETKTETTVVKSATGAAPADAGEAVPPSAPTPDEKESSPLDKIDLDNLDLSEADGAAMRIGG